jgi:hypothetical protein
VTKGRTSSNANNYAIRLSSNNFVFYFRNSVDTAWILYTISNVVFANSQYFACFSFKFGSSSSIKVSINGIFYTGSWSGDGNTLPVVNDEVAKIGAISSASEVFNGSIDTIYIYNRELSTDEMSFLYNFHYDNFIQPIWRKYFVPVIPPTPSFPPTLKPTRHILVR